MKNKSARTKLLKNPFLDDAKSYESTPGLCKAADDFVKDLKIRSGQSHPPGTQPVKKP